MPPAPAIPLGFGRRSAPSKPAQCPCGWGAYNRCCGPLINGEQLAATAQQLIRFRFSAFALAARDPQAIEHLLRTHLEPGLTAAARRKALMESCRTIQELLGHKDGSTTMIYTHVLNRGPLGVRSPADIL